MKITLKLALFAMLLPLTAMAQTYAVTGTEEAGLLDVINAIRDDAAGEDVEIQFMELDIGEQSITFENGDEPNETWGKITLSGRVTNSGTAAAVIINHNIDVATYNLEIIKEDYPYAIAKNGTGHLSIGSGTIISAADNAVYNNSSQFSPDSTGGIYIGGGSSITATNGNAIYNNAAGYLTIGGGTITATNGSAIYCGSRFTSNITLSGNPLIEGSITARMGTIIANSLTPADNIYTLNFSPCCTEGAIAVIGGAPYIERFAITNASYGLMPSGSDIALRSGPGYSYAESNGVYTITNGPYGHDIPGTINAIRDDAAGEDVEIQFMGLDIGEQSITFENGDEPNETWGKITLSGKIAKAYIFNSLGVNMKITADIEGYVHNYGSVILSGNPTINGVIINHGTLSVDAEFAPTAGKVYTLDFVGSYTIGATAVINGKDKFDFFALANDSYGLTNAETGENLVIVLNKGFDFALTENAFEVYNEYRGKAIQNVINEIRETAAGEPVAIKFGSGTDALNIHDAAAIQFSNGIENWGSITLSGNITNSSISNYGLIVLNSGITVTSAANMLKTNYGTPITNNGGTLNITGGEIASENGTAIINQSGSTLTISGGDISAKTASFVVQNLSEETLTISGGKISAKGSSSTAVSSESYGNLNISGGEISATSGIAVRNGSYGYLTISGGKISATTGRAVFNAFGKVIVHEGANITSANAYIDQGTINNANGQLIITGATIENTATANFGNAIYSNATDDGEEPAIIISGGEISAIAPRGYAIRNTGSYYSTLAVSGGTITSANTYVSDNGATIYSANYALVKITGATIINKAASVNGNAVYTMGMVELGNAPSIIGYIKTNPSNLSVITNPLEEDLFAPAGKTYDLDFTYYSGIAVVNGADFIDNFALVNSAGYRLAAIGTNLVIESEAAAEAACLAQGKIYGEDGTCKTALQVAESVCSSEPGKRWQKNTGKCVSPIRAITPETLPKNAKVEIFTLNGKILNSQLIPTQPGIYIVKINKETFRIVVK